MPSPPSNPNPRGKTSPDETVASRDPDATQDSSQQTGASAGEPSGHVPAGGTPPPESGAAASSPAPGREPTFLSVELTDAFGLSDPDDVWLQRVRAATASTRVEGASGTYELIEEISRGGQGIVYRARQAGTNRIVAVKRMISGALASPGARRRFQREVEAAAALQHPNIVTVFESEIVDGLPLLAMEWIDGRPIDRWAEQLAVDMAAAGVAKTDRTSATERGGSDSRGVRQSGLARRGGAARQRLEEILRVYLKVCDAIQHAHQRGIVHRDLKPSNILVDRAGEPHVLDFGLAKRIDQAAGQEPELTIATDFLGTPAYASPEQTSGDPNAIDTRTDVYALGVIAYRLLTGRPPYETGRNLAELFDRIRHSEPKAPSLVAGGLDRELDAIVLKAMAKQKEQRYASVDALAADLRRYVAGEPISVHPPSAAYQLRKLVQRHRLASALAGALALLIVVSGVGAGVMAWRIEIARRAAVHAKDKEASARRTAERVHAYMQRTFEEVRPDMAEHGELTVRELLDLRSAALANELGDDQEVRAAIELTFGRTYRALALYAQAERHLETALELLRRQYGREAREVLPALSELASVEMIRARERKALAAAARERGRVTMLPLDPADWTVVWQREFGAAALLGERVHVSRAALGDAAEQTLAALTTLAGVLVDQGQSGAAESLLRDAYNRLGSGKSAEAGFEVGLALADTLIERHEFERGQELLRELQTLAGSLKSGGQRERSASVAQRFARLYEAWQRPDEAEKWRRLE